jgi:hypothetical protein
VNAVQNSRRAEKFPYFDLLAELIAGIAAKKTYIDKNVLSIVINIFVPIIFKS